MSKAAALERLVHVGGNTEMGALLRRYWHPVATLAQLEAADRILPVTILGERLVVFRDEAGAYAAIQESCPHRGVSLAYGFLEGNGLRCPYHGWLFDQSGACIERPFEPRNTTSIRAVAYPVRLLGGLLFVYMGPSESLPPVPPFEILLRADICREIHLQEDLKCNWLQIQENAADTTHTSYLHSRMLERFGEVDDSGFELPMLAYGFQPFSWGIVKSWKYRSDDGSVLSGWGNLLVFPTMLRIESELHWRVPVNDEVTRIFIIRAIPRVEGVPDWQNVQLPPRTNDNGYHMRDFYSQDAMAWETQGVISARQNEHLGASDIGISMYREMLEDQLNRVARGEDVSIGRASSEGTVVDLREYMGGYLPASAPPDANPPSRKSATEIFNLQHREVVLAPP